MVQGRSLKTWRKSEPWITTRAELTDQLGLIRLEVSVRGRTTVAERIVADESPSSQGESP